jgi:RNA polymerase-binding protein DksA
MATLSQQEITRFQNLLEQRREALIDEIHAALVKSGDESFIELAGRVHDAAEESVAELLMAMNISSSKRETAELTDVEAALTRIRNGVFGACIDCGGPVGRDRLNAYPTAKRCIDCQSRRENMRGGRDSTPSL